jgi:hypothetical protein
MQVLGGDDSNGSNFTSLGYAKTDILPGEVVYACNPSSWEAKTRGLRVVSHPEPQARPCLREGRVHGGSLVGQCEGISLLLQSWELLKGRGLVSLRSEKSHTTAVCGLDGRA